MTIRHLDRRELLLAFTALAVAGTASAEALARSPAETPAGTQIGMPPTPGEPVLAQSRTFPFAQLTAKKTASGESRAVIHGALPTGEMVEMHETTLLAGQMPHPPHKHRHSEFIMIREGQIEFYNEGTPERVGPGGVIFVASNLLHGMKNVGDTTANYFVVAIGQESGIQQV